MGQWWFIDSGSGKSHYYPAGVASLASYVSAFSVVQCSVSSHRTVQHSLVLIAVSCKQLVMFL